MSLAANKPATAAKQDDLATQIGEVSSSPSANTVLGRLKAIADALLGTLTARPSTDQDPIYDHANGEKATVTSSTAVFTPPAGCKFARFDATVDTFIRTDNAAAADDGEAIRLIAGQPEILPVVAGVAVRAYAASSSVLRITPMKVRS